MTLVPLGAAGVANRVVGAADGTKSVAGAVAAPGGPLEFLEPFSVAVQAVRATSMAKRQETRVRCISASMVGRFSHCGPGVAGLPRAHSPLISGPGACPQSSAPA